MRYIFKHACVRACVRAYVHACVYACVHKIMCMPCSCVSIETQMHAYIDTKLQVCVCACACVRACVRACVLVCCAAIQNSCKKLSRRRMALVCCDADGLFFSSTL